MDPLVNAVTGSSDGSGEGFAGRPCDRVHWWVWCQGPVAGPMTGSNGESAVRDHCWVQCKELLVGSVSGSTGDPDDRFVGRSSDWDHWWVW